MSLTVEYKQSTEAGLPEIFTEAIGTGILWLTSCVSGCICNQLFADTFFSNMNPRFSKRIQAKH